jgi:hypothetical protein
MLSFELSAIDLILAVAAIILLILYLTKSAGKPPNEEKQTFTIAHEIAHQKLEHKSPIFSNLTEKETQKQEDEDYGTGGES